MRPEQLFERVAPEHRPAVEQLFASYASARKGRVDETIDGFANAIHERGLLSDEGLHDFLTYHALSVGALGAILGELDPAASRYQLMALLGHGAMGEVYLGRDTRLRRTVAVKRVHAELQGEQVLVQRFLNEAQVTAQLDHPAIVPVYGLERDDSGSLAYAMKLVRGVTLTRYLETARQQIAERGRPDAQHSLKARIETFIPVLNAIAYAHRRGVIHRDLKPDNIMVGSFGEVLVMDWGIARVLDDDASEAARTAAHDAAPAPDVSVPPGEQSATGMGHGTTHLTQAGTLMGTPAYMSPEQAGGGELDAASDQYTLGLLLHEIVTLSQAMSAPSVEVMIAKAMRALRNPIGHTAEPVPRELAAIIAKASALAPRDRYASVAALAEDLKRFLRDESVEADPDRGLRNVTRWIGKHRGLAMALAAGALFLACAVIVLFVWRGQVALEAEREAARERDRAMTGLEGIVDARAKTMTQTLHRYEALLEGIAATAALVLSEPAPPSGAVVYAYAGGKSDPPTLPGGIVESAVYRQAASLRADFAASHGVDRQALRWRADQLARLEPALRTSLLRSAGEEAASLTFEAAEKLVLETGVPLIWTYFGTADGLSVGMPGTWWYDDSPGVAGYDHRREDWYAQTVGTRGPRWSATADENGLGLEVNCAQAVHDREGRLLGVAALDLWLHRFIDELLEIPALTSVGAEALLIDTHGRVVIRARDKESARTLTEYEPAPYEHAHVRSAMADKTSGHVAVDAGRLALWTTLGNTGLTYLVVGPEAALLGAGAATP